MKTHKVSAGNGFIEVLQTVVWVNSRQIGSTIHTQVLDTLVSLWERSERENGGREVGVWGEGKVEREKEKGEQGVRRKSERRASWEEEKEEEEQEEEEEEELGRREGNRRTQRESEVGEEGLGREEVGSQTMYM